MSGPSHDPGSARRSVSRIDDATSLVESGEQSSKTRDRGGSSRASSPRDRRDPETVSQPVTAVVTILAVLVGAWVLLSATDVLVPGAIAIVGGGLLTATITAANRQTPGGRAIASCCAVAAAASVVIAIGLAVQPDVTAIEPWYRAAVVIAIAFAAFGATATLSGAIGSGAVASALPIAVLTSIPIVGYVVAYTPFVRSLWTGEARRTTGSAGQPTGPTGLDTLDRPPIEAWLLRPESEILAVLTLFGILAVTLASIAFLLPRLPIPELLPGDRRAAAGDRIEWAADLFWTSLAYGIALAGVLAVGHATVLDQGSPEQLVPIFLWLEAAVLAIAFEPSIRQLLLGTIGLLWIVWVALKLPFVYRLRYSSLVGWLPVLLGGAIAVLFARYLYPLVYVREIRPELEALSIEGQFMFVPVIGVAATPADIDAALAPPNGHLLAGLGLLFVLGLLLAVLVGVSAAGLLRLLGDRGAPGTVAATALVAGAIFAAIDGAATIAVVVPVVCAVVAWDAAVYGVSITEELGRSTAARGPTIVHTVGTASVGLVAIGAIVAIDALLVGRISIWEGATVAVSIAIALLVALVALKRRGKRIR